MMLVDSHCHLHEVASWKCRGHMQKHAEESPAHEGQWNVLPVSVGYSQGSNKKCAELAKRLEIPFVLGIAPQTAIKEDISKLDEWISFIRENSPNAIGEIGLDYHWAENELHVRREEAVFTRMLDLAQEMRLPIVVHSREASHDVLDMLELRRFDLPLMMHFFSGSVSEAKRAIDMGGLISITPLHSKSRRQVIKEVELDYLLVETDAPYVVRTPEEVIKSVEYICEAKELGVEEVAEATASNAKRFFRV